jgi:hypothetical protein
MKSLIDNFVDFTSVFGEALALNNAFNRSRILQ